MNDVDDYSSSLITLSVIIIIILGFLGWIRLTTARVDSDFQDLYHNHYVTGVRFATEFYSNLASLADDPIVSSKPYIYKEFVSNVLNGSSISYFFITENTPFRMLYIISQMKSDSEMAKNIIDDIKHQELFLACNPNANILMPL